MECILASGNKGKLAEIKELLSAFSWITVESLKDIDPSFDVEETGTTFEENSLLKARAVADYFGKVALADDSGLEVDALQGRPGVYSARYGGANLDDNGRNLLLLEELKGVPKEERTARFVSVITCALPNGSHISFRGTCEGRIAPAPAGSGGFGYDPVFFLPEMRRHMAELTMEEKNRISHRGKALKELFLFIQKEGEPFFRG